jgi:hypothetical protein
MSGNVANGIEVPFGAIATTLNPVALLPLTPPQNGCVASNLLRDGLYAMPIGVVRPVAGKTVFEAGCAFITPVITMNNIAPRNAELFLAEYLCKLLIGVYVSDSIWSFLPASLRGDRF